MTTRNNVRFTGVAAIMSIFFIAMGIGTITPALNSIMEAYPQLPVSTIYLTSTLPSLAVIPSAVIAGMLAGNKVKYKMLSALGILLFVVGGVAPYFTNDNFTLILLGRAIFGIGLGIISPLGNALVLGHFEGDKRASMMGMGTLMMNVGGIIFQFLGGFFAGIKWYYCFLPHAIAIISLVLVLLFLPEPVAAAVPEGAAGQEKPKLPLGVWIASVLFGAGMFITYPMLMGMSTYLSILNLGDAATAAIVLSFFTVGGMIAGVIFGTLFKVTGRFLIGVALAIIAIGYAILLFVPNVIAVTFGAALVGVGFSIIMPATMMIVGMMCSPEQVAFASSIILAVMNLFAFLSTYWIGIIANITGDAIIAPMKVGMAIAVIGAIVFFIINPFPKTDNPS